MGKPLLGHFAQLFLGAAGTSAATECENCKDVKVNMNSEMPDVTTRASKGWKQTTPGLKTVEISFAMLDVPDDPSLILLRNAWLKGTPIAAKALNAENGWGPDGDFYVADFSQDQADPISYSVKLSLAKTEREFTFAGGSTPPSGG